MNNESVSIPLRAVVDGSCILAKKISAIPLEGKADAPSGTARLGAVLQMPAGSRLEVCGEGFNPRTVKVRCGGAYFFVFREDLPLQHSCLQSKRDAS